jgi:hypothetical protein
MKRIFVFLFAAATAARGIASMGFVAANPDGEAAPG